jgi:hypothetical protein
MVLIGNNNILTIEQFHKNRCDEKNKIKEILIQMKYDKENEQESPFTPVSNEHEINGDFTKNTGILPIQTKNYDCIKKK